MPPPPQKKERKEIITIFFLNFQIEQYFTNFKVKKKCKSRSGIRTQIYLTYR